MRKAYDPHLVFDKKGRILALATGSDACSEHEGGIVRLMKSLGAKPPGSDEDQVVIEALRKGKEVQYPDLFERLYIRNPRPVHLDLVEDEAILWTDFAQLHAEYNTVGNLLQSYEFSYSSESLFVKRDVNIAAMWDENSFAIRVRTPKYVKALKAFYEAILEGKVLFGGRFFEVSGMHLGGIILVNSQSMRTEHVQAQRKAQREYEKKLRLEALSRLPELNEKLRSLLGNQRYWDCFTYIWAAWADEDESQGVRYRINAGQRALQAGLNHGALYTFEELEAFAQRIAQKVAA